MTVSGNVTIFSAYAHNPRDWTQKELAEFYRVENALIQAGMRVTTERGLTDEGEPWFIFCRATDNEPVVHFARIDGQYVIVSEAFDAPIKGHDFQAMILSLLRRHRLNSSTAVGNSNVFVHPAALLIAIVGVAFFKTLSPAKAADDSSEANLPAKAAPPAAGSVQAQTNNSDQVRTAATKTTAHSSETEAWAEQSLRIAIATIASLSQAEVAAAKEAIDQATAIAQSLETGIPVKMQANNKPHETLDPLNQFISPTSPETGLTLASNSLPNHEALQLDPALIGTALSMINNLAKIPAAGDESQESLTLQIKHTQVSANVMSNEAEVPVFATSSKIVLYNTVDVSTHLSQQNHLSLSPSSQDHSLNTAQPVTQTITISLANLSSLSDVHTLGGIVAFEINLKALGESSSSSFLAKNNIQLLSQATMPSLLGINPSEFNGGAALTNLKLDQDFTHVSTSNLLDNPNKFSSSLQTSSSTSTQEPQTVTSTVPITQVGAGDGTSQGAQTSGLNPIHISLSAVTCIQGSAFAASLLQFIHDVPGIKVSVSESNNYAFYNPADISAHNTPLGEITLSFDDGSSISIIGQKSEIYSISSHLF